MSLRAVIFCLDSVLIKSSKAPPGSGLRSASKEQIRTELRDLFDFLRERNILPIVLSNRDWIGTDSTTGIAKSIDSFLIELFGPHQLYIMVRHNGPFKPTAQVIPWVLQRHDLHLHEVVMLGVSKEDFQTAVNANILFLNACWDQQQTDYGFRFDSPAEVMRFIDVFALRAHHWFYAIDDPVTLRSMAPYTTRLDPNAKDYSDAAVAAFKQANRDRQFFLLALISSLYFTGIIQEADFLACVPKHGAGFGNPSMDDILPFFAHSFRAKYIPDLIVRHTDAPSSRALRNQQQLPQALTQFNTIHLTKRPLKGPVERYKTPINITGKTVLVFDDFCTSGYSLEAARHFLVWGGAKAVLVPCLKTVNRGYTVITPTHPVDPYAPAAFDASELPARVLPYETHIVDREATVELHDMFAKYRGWKR